MGTKRTTLAERNEFIDLKPDGHTLAEIAVHTGWSWACIRYWWRRFRDGARKALNATESPVRSLFCLQAGSVAFPRFEPGP